MSEGESITYKTQRERRQVVWICAFLALVTFAVFGQTARFEFVNYDDNFYVYDNAEVMKGLSPGGVGAAFIHKEGGLWNPLVTISHMLDCQLYGLTAGGHHLTNVFLHLASVILLFFVFQEMTGSLWRSAFVATVFAIHPLRVESVAWVSERKDVLSGLFFMLTVGAYLRYVHRPESILRYLVVFLLFGLGLMSKPMLVTLPGVLLLLDYWPLNRLCEPSSPPGDSEKRYSINWRAVLEKIPLLALSCGVCMATMAGPKQPDSGEAVPFLTRMGEAPVSFVIYLRQMIWPTGLAVIYPHSEETSRWWWPAALALLGVISAGCYFLRKKHPYLMTGWLWNLGMLAPVSGIQQISRHARADHYTYLPQIGVYLMVTWLVADGWAVWRFRRRTLAILSGMVLGAFMISAWKQTSYWKDTDSLWRHTIACTSGNYFVQNNLGLSLFKKGKVDEAVTHFKKAVEINPDYAEAHNNLGIALSQPGGEDEALIQFKKAVEINPEYSDAQNNFGLALDQQGLENEAIAHYKKALETNPDYADAHYNLGNAFLKTGRTDEAIVHYQRTLEIDPNYDKAENNLGKALSQKGEMEAAIAHYKKAIEIDPGNADAQNSIGIAVSQKGQLDEAIFHFGKAVALKPDNAPAQNNLANAQFQKGRVDEAVDHYNKAVGIKPDFAEAHYNLGDALLTKGNEEEAIAHFKKAVEINPNLVGAQVRLGVALRQKGHFEEAVGHYTKAVVIDPQSLLATNNLAWLLATCPDESVRNGAKAVELARKAEEISHGKRADVEDTLAAAYAESGRYPEAVEAAERALEIAVRQGNGEQAKEIRGRLGLYRAGKAYREGTFNAEDAKAQRGD